MGAPLLSPRIDTIIFLHLPEVISISFLESDLLCDEQGISDEEFSVILTRRELTFSVKV